MPTAKRIMATLPRVHIPELYVESERWFSYKRISLRRVFEDVKIPGHWAEFGVFKGDCARIMLDALPQNSSLFLFDSFEGLPEDWGGKWKRGHFGLGEGEEPVFANPNVVCVKGWFKDTLPEYFKNDQILSLIHMDADLYSSTWDVLRNINHVIVPGTVILFDEYIMSTKAGYSEDEHRAFTEWVEQSGRKFEYLWRTKWVQVAVRITK